MGASHSNLWRGFPAVREKRGTLVADTTTTVTLTDLGLYEASSVEVINDGATTDIYVTLDGTAPTSDGTGADAVKMFSVHPGESRTFDAAPTEVKLRSSGIPSFRLTLVGVA